MRGKGLAMGRSGATTVVILIASVFIPCSASWPVPVSSSSWESTESISGENDGRLDKFLGLKILKREAPLPAGYFQSQGQSQQPSGGYSPQSPSTPSLSYGGVAPSLAQGPVIENLPQVQGQNEIFSSLTSSSPDMFYFSPRDQVLYKVSRLPIDSFSGGAAGLNVGVTGATATTPATTSAPAPAPISVQSNTSPPSPFEIRFEVEEETGGDYVGGFGGSSSTTTTTPAPTVAAVVTVNRNSFCRGECWGWCSSNT